MNKRKFSVPAALFLAVLLSSCMKSDYFPCVKPKGSAVEEVIAFSPFTGIHLKMHANVHLSQGNDYSVSLIAPENVLDHIHISRHGNSVVVENNRCIRNRADEIELFVTMPELKELKLSGSGNIFVSDEFEGKDVDLIVSGSGNIDFFGVYETIHSTINGSGNIIAEGHCLDHFMEVSGSGKADARALVSDFTDVKIKGSGSAFVNALEKINAHISGSGNVYYSGNPTVNGQINGSGKIVHKGRW